MADDLGDEWWLGGQNVAISSNSSSSEGEDEEDSQPALKKLRKSNNSEVTKTKPSETPSNVKPEEPTVAKQKKKRRKRITDEMKENPPKAGAPADLISVIQKQFQGKLSPVEWDEMQLSADVHFGESNTENLVTSDYLKSIVPKWNKMVKKGDKNNPKCGSPLVLIIASSAVRSVELVRQVTDFRDGKGKLAKLFAKHAKLEEQQEFLKKTVVHLGIGTPNRINKLLDSEHLGLSKTSVVVLDWNWRNVKLKTLTDIPEIRQDLLDLFKGHIFPHVRNNSCKLYLM